jgi:hypothetical protein
MNFVLIESEPARKLVPYVVPSRVQTADEQTQREQVQVQVHLQVQVEAQMQAASATKGRRVRHVAEMVSALSAPKVAPESSKTSDRRWAYRKPTETPGYIGHAKNPNGVRCVVRNTSSSGALVEVCSGSDRYSNPADEVPDRLTLVFVSYKERTEVACAVMRRSGRMLGVRYIGPFRTIAAPAPITKMAVNLKKR